MSSADCATVSNAVEARMRSAARAVKRATAALRTAGAIGRAIGGPLTVGPPISARDRQALEDADRRSADHPSFTSSPIGE